MSITTYQELDNARASLMSRIDNPHSTAEARQAAYENYLNAIRATGIKVRRPATLADMMRARGVRA